MPTWNRFAKDNLGHGEKILYQTWTHWITIVTPVFWAVFFVTVMTLSPSIDLSELKELHVIYLWENPWRILSILALPLTLSYTITLAATIIKTLTTEITITNQRVIWKTGLVWRKTGELTRRVIEGNNVQQSVLGRALDYGTVQVNGIGSRTLQLKTIVDPFNFRKELNKTSQSNPIQSQARKSAAGR